MLLETAWLFIFLHQLPKHQAFPHVSGLCVGTTNNVTTTGFVLIVLLVILLWLLWLYSCLYRFDYIALNVLLIILLWLYCFDYIALIILFWLNYSCRIINCIALIVLRCFYCYCSVIDPIVLIIFVLGSIFCYWYHSHHLISKYKQSKT